MGLQDRDYMRERRPADDRLLPRVAPARSWVWPVLAVVAGAVLVIQLYGFYERVLERKRLRGATPSMAVPADVDDPGSSPQAKREPPPRLLQPPRPFPAAPAGPVGAPQPRVAKCVVNGVTTYSDSACDGVRGAQALAVDGRLNLADGLPRSMIHFDVPSSDGRVTEGSGGGDYRLAARKAACGPLEAAIRDIDAQARLPQHPLEQDRLAKARKEARDQQFRLRC